MENIIRELKEKRDKKKDQFIEESLIKRNSKPDTPVPDTNSTLDEILEYNKAIIILENKIQEKPQSIKINYQCRVSDIG